MKKLASIIVSITLLFACACSISGCVENADAVQTEVSLPVFKDIATKFNDFRLDCSKYIDENGYDVCLENDGYTPNDEACKVTYMEANDGKYKRAELQKYSKVDGEEFQIRDCYYKLSDSELYITRTYCIVDGDSFTFSAEHPIEEYVVVDGALYLVDQTEGTLEVDSKPDSHDFYLTFDEIADLYGAK